MAYREVGMVAVREMLRRWQAGDGFRAIARAVGVDRATVAEYIRGAMTAGVAREGPAAADAQIAAILAARRPGRPGALETPSAEWAALGPQQDTIRRWLADDGLRLTKVHRRLTAQGVTVSYSTLYRFARRHCGFTPGAVTVRVAEPAPGELAEIDFGMLGWWVDPTTTRRRRIDGLLVTLAASRYAFLWIALRQDLATVLDGLEAAWAFFGGVPRRLVVDNLRAVVAGADRYRPTLAPVFLEYAQYRGFVVDPAVPRHATGKPKVERGIPYVRQDFFRGETFRDPADMQARALRWCRDLAGLRVHGTTRQLPRIVFETTEQTTLLPLAPAPFDRPTWAHCTVHPDHHVQFRRALYSVPTRYIGQRVEVRGDRQLVRLYQRGTLIKVHPAQPPGGRATDYADYPAERAPYAQRAPAAVIAQAQAVGPAVGQFAARLLSGTFPWARLRQAQKLLRLAARYGPVRLEPACARALGFELLDVARVEAIVRAALSPGLRDDAAPSPPPLPARFARPPHSFVHPPPTEVAHGDHP